MSATNPIPYMQAVKIISKDTGLGVKDVATVLWRISGRAAFTPAEVDLYLVRVVQVLDPRHFRIEHLQKKPDG